MAASSKSSRIDIAGIRRQQIVEAAVAVIAEQGIQNLSLSEIEKKIGMSRGQLTDYYKAKEEILLAVFDRPRLPLHPHPGGGEGHRRQCAARLVQIGVVGLTELIVP